MPGIAEHEVERAHWKAKDIAIQAKSGGYVPAEARETINDWFDRWVDARKAKGLRSTRHDRGRYGKWIAEGIGTTGPSC
jgi:hypothetical protein